MEIELSPPDLALSAIEELRLDIEANPQLIETRQALEEARALGRQCTSPVRAC